LKIAFNLSPKTGPFGGGNSFLQNISEGLRHHGHEVHFDLSQDDLDFVVVLDPRWNHGMISFNSRDLVLYLHRNTQTLVVHRINECDERKGTHGMNRKLRRINYLADQTVIVGSWLKHLDLFAKSTDITIDSNEIRTILNGSDSRVFYPDDSKWWNGQTALKIVTHHWSAHPYKGRETYLFLDQLLGTSEWQGRIEFTYIGNIRGQEEFTNTKFIPALSESELAKELRKHHCYLTASRNEPGSNHQNDGGLSGLPILFLNSGSLPEYCQDFGFGFETSAELPCAIESLMSNYTSLRKRMSAYPHHHVAMVENYIKLFEELLEARETKLALRNLGQNKMTLLRLLFPM
jgi:hypothetical protein